MDFLFIFLSNLFVKNGLWWIVLGMGWNQNHQPKSAAFISWNSWAFVGHGKAERETRWVAEGSKHLVLSNMSGDWTVFGFSSFLIVPYRMILFQRNVKPGTHKLAMTFFKSQTEISHGFLVERVARYKFDQNFVEHPKTGWAMAICINFHEK